MLFMASLINRIVCALLPLTNTEVHAVSSIEQRQRWIVSPRLDDPVQTFDSRLFTSNGATDTLGWSNIASLVLRWISYDNATIEMAVRQQQSAVVS